MVILAKRLIYTVDIWAIQFQLTLKSMWTIERLSRLPVPVLTCKVLHKFDAFVEKYSSGEIYLMNSTPLLLGLNTIKNGIIRLSPYLHVYLMF